MEIRELKTVWDENIERCYSLYRINGKSIRIRGVFGRTFVAEIFSPILCQWTVIAYNTERVLEHTIERMNQEIAILLDEVKLILGYKEPPGSTLRFCYDFVTDEDMVKRAVEAIEKEREKHRETLCPDDDS